MLIKWLGGHSKDECEALEIKRAELVSVRRERDQYKAFAESLATYCDTYPVWGAQREFRRHMQEIGQPLSGEYGEEPKQPEILDIYLGRVVNSFVTLMRSGVKADFVRLNHIMFDERALNEARGECYLVRRDNPSLKS